ncbi:hypothetical protein HGB13_01600 [bacterium]|nr:hypothetical protein [bacterium]
MKFAAVLFVLFVFVMPPLYVAWRIGYRCFKMEQLVERHAGPEVKDMWDWLAINMVACYFLSASLRATLLGKTDAGHLRSHAAHARHFSAKAEREFFETMKFGLEYLTRKHQPAEDYTTKAPFEPPVS